MFNLSTDQRWSNLSPQQRSGESCVWCSNHTAPMVPVGRSVTTGAQVFACEGACCTLLEGTAIIARAVGELAPIDVRAAKERDELSRIRILVENVDEFIGEVKDVLVAGNYTDTGVGYLRARLSDLVNELDTARSYCRWAAIADEVGDESP